MEIIKYLLEKFYNEEKINILFILLIALFINIFQINILSYLTAQIINNLKDNNKKKIFKYYKFFLIVLIIYIFIFYIYKNIQYKVVTKLRPWIKHNLLTILIKINNYNFQDINFNQINSPLNRVSAIIFQVFNNIITFLLPNISLLIIVFFYFFYINYSFAILFLFFNLLIVMTIYIMWPKIMKNNLIFEEDSNNNERDTSEVLNNIDKIIQKAQTDKIINDLDISNNKIKNSSYNFYNISNNCSTIINIILFFTIGILVFYLIKLYLNKTINITVFITFFTILLIYRDRISSIIQQLPDYIEFIGRCNSVLDVFKNYKQEYLKIMNKKYPKYNINFNTIKIQNLSFYYNNDKKIFNNFNLNIDTDNNDIILIKGESGKGKSTLAKLLIKMYNNYTGNIYIDNIDINNIDNNYIRENITYINQNSKLFDKNIIDNLYFGCNNLKKCEKYYNEILIFDKINNLLNKINFKNNSGSSGEKLSGGQRQIINIINGLILTSNILILDEPTNALDIDLKKNVIDLIKYFKKYKKCIIIISHDKDINNICDKIISL
jgi:ABC-type bacteriocin/lantibiotic exporter with double-glycine peptidase domain